MTIDRHLADLQRLAEQAAASVAPLDLAAHERALIAEYEAELEARRQASAPASGIDWDGIRRAAEAVSRRQQGRRGTAR